MSTNYRRVFGERKTVIAMVHLGALPGAPLYDAEAGMDGLIEAARKDLRALSEAGFDAVMFGNENDRPYETKVDAASTAAMAAVIGRLRREIAVPFGVNLLWDPLAWRCHAASGLRSGPWPNNRADEENQLRRIPVPARDHSPSNMAGFVTGT